MAYTKNTSTQRIQAHKEYKHTKNTSTQRIQAHKEYKHTKNTSTQRIQTHKEYRYTKKKHRKNEKIRYTQKRDTGKMLRKKLFFVLCFF